MEGNVEVGVARYYSDIDHVDDVNQLTSADEADQFAESFSGTLSFTPESANKPDAEAVHLPPPPEPVDPDDIHKNKLVFEIVNTRIVTADKDKHVVYSVCIMTSATDRNPVTIHRRFSDFHHLNKQLSKCFPNVMSGISFPKKKVLGNFLASTISDRSKSFEKYLTEIAAVDMVRSSAEFLNFFYKNDVIEGHNYLRERNYSAAATILQRAQLVQRKLLGDHNRNTIYTLCAAAAALWANQQHSVALTYCESALECMAADTTNKYLVPLINLSIQVCWHLGKDKKDLENRLQFLKEQGLNTSPTQSLLDLVVSSPPV